ncbi:MAG: hypothetical protein LAN71_17020 [Acidobacteriia bacterium]|nr:hypothetical protein [Terriglobia bacterium]
MDKCPNCEEDNKEILAILNRGIRYRCKNCFEIFICWNKGVEYSGNEEFNDWFSKNKAELYDIAVQHTMNIVGYINEKDWPYKIKILAINIVIENIKLFYYGDLGVKDMEEEISNEMHCNEYFRPKRSYNHTKNPKVQDLGSDINYIM